MPLAHHGPDRLRRGRGRGARVLVLVLGGVLLLAACAPSTSPAADTAPTTAVPVAGNGPTVEERRLDGEVPREILARSGFDDVAPALGRALAGARSVPEAERVVAEQGRALWQRAVARAQGREPGVGDLSADDDRPLYWARLGMATEIRGWQPAGVGPDDAQRTGLIEALETSSRGQDSVTFPEGVTRVLVSGFDPFTLDEDIRTSNPSGAAALALDGVVAEGPAGPVGFEAVTFPVRWTDFADGTVERVMQAHLPRVDLFATTSQGSPEVFDLERFNGAWRGGAPDNEDISETGLAPVPDPGSQPQFTTSTLSSAEIAAAVRGRFPVVDNTRVVEVPAGAQEPVGREDGPTPGSQARQGGGGDYLSNEVAYRATLVRDRLGLGESLPGGHVHTPVLFFGPENGDPATGAVTDATLVANRLDIVAQTREILLQATAL